VAEGDRTAKLSPEEAKRKIALFVREGWVVLSGHCRRDSMPKQNVSSLDIANVLRTGEIIREPEWSEEHGNWEYVVEGVDLEEDDLRAMTVFFDDELTLLIVTVY
jgi:hypothetical protein